MDDTARESVGADRAPNSGRRPDPEKPTAAILVGGYGGLGVHTLLNAIRFGPGNFENVVFLSVGVVDSGNFKGADAVDDLRHHTEQSLDEYVDLARRLGMPAIGYMSIGTDPSTNSSTSVVEVKKRYPRTDLFSPGNWCFRRTPGISACCTTRRPFALQRRLQWDGVPMVILPTRVK